MDALRLVDDWQCGAVGVALVTHDGSVALHGDSDRSFELASVTKILTALGVLVAVEEGLIALDDPLGPPGCSVRHLLAHAGGLAPDQRRLLTEPGTRRIYSNAGFELLGEAVSEGSGMEFGAYVHDAVLDPLGMTRTRLAGSPAHGATGSARDLAAVAWELLRPDPTILARETRMQLTSTQFPEIPGVLPGFGQQRPNPWGLGVEIRGQKSPHWTGTNNAPNTFGHFGRSGTFLWVDPMAGAACVVLTDREFGDWAVTEWPVFSDAVLRQI